MFVQLHFANVIFSRFAHDFRRDPQGGRNGRVKIEANLVEKCMVYGRRMPEVRTWRSRGHFKSSEDYYCEGNSNIILRLMLMC